MSTLDHFVGRVVEEVVPGDKDGEWGIKLEGGTVIWNLDKKIKLPKGSLDGTILARADLTGKDPILEFHQGATKVATVKLNADKNSVNRTEGQASVSPRTAVEAAEHLPPDPTPERVVEGPETPRQTPRR